MNINKNLNFRKLAAMAAFVTVLFSCDGPMPSPGPNSPDPDPVLPELTVADSMKTVLNGQIKAMQALLTEVETLEVANYYVDEEGKYEIMLSNGIEFTIYPDSEEIVELLSYSQEGTTAYWTMFDGEVYTELKDDSDSKISLQTLLKTYLTGEQIGITSNDEDYYPTVYNLDDPVQIFAIEPHLDVDGDMYAMTCKFATDETVIIEVDGYTPAYFVEEDGTDPIENYYVGNSETKSLKLVIKQGVDFDVEISEGWTAEKNISDAGIYVDITAPAKGEDNPTTAQLKVLAKGLFELGEVSLTSEPFHEVFATAIKANVNPVSGIGTYVYGLSPKSEYSDVVALEKAAQVQNDPEQTVSGVSALAEGAVSVAFETLGYAELTPGDEYVFWAVKGESVYKYEFVAFGVTASYKNISFIDADLSMAIKGDSPVYSGVVEKTENWYVDILNRVNDSMLDSVIVQYPYEYSGKVTEFAGELDTRPETTYVTWVIADAAGEYEYTEDDIFVFEFTTAGVVPGGEKQVTAGTEVVKETSVTVPLSSEGAEMIYYTFATGTEAKRKLGATDSDKYEYLKAHSGRLMSKGASVDAKAERLEPNTEYYVFAVAIDSEGRYGAVATKTVKTAAVVYDDTIELKAEQISVTSKSAQIKVYDNKNSSRVLSDYIYWVGTNVDYGNQFASDKRTAQKFMACYPEDEIIQKSMRTYGTLDEDGQLTLTGLRNATQYVFLIMEKGETNYSKVAMLAIETLDVDLGDIVMEGTDEWNNAKSQIVIEWNERAFSQGANSALMSTYGFSFSCPTSFTAYVLCGSEGFFDDPSLKEVEYKIIEVESYCSRSWDMSYTPIVNGDYMDEPDYYKDGEKRGGQLMNAYKYYVHGVPNMGFATYFAQGTHGENNCSSWENGACTQYQYALDKIQRHLTMEPSYARAEAFGLTGQEAEDWAQALYQAYLPYYQDAKPIILENDGSPLAMSQPYGTGVNEDGIIPDRVIVVLKDLDGNYYEPMMFEVPNYFQK